MADCIIVSHDSGIKDVIVSQEHLVELVADAFRQDVVGVNFEGIQNKQTGVRCSCWGNFDVTEVQKVGTTRLKPIVKTNCLPDGTRRSSSHQWCFDKLGVQYFAICPNINSRCIHFCCAVLQVA